MQKYIFTLTSFLIFIVAYAQAQVTFQKTYPSGYFSSTVLQTNDGGYVIAGDGGISSTSDYYLIKIGPIGNILWAKLYGTANHDYCHHMSQEKDGGFVLAGETKSVNGSDDIYIVKTDSNGNYLWSKIYGGTKEDYCYAIQSTSDGGSIITGGTTSFPDKINNDSLENIYVIRIDTIGDTLWTKIYGGTGYDYGKYSHQTTDGGFITVGYTTSFDTTGTYKIYLVKSNSKGNVQWSKIYSGIGNDFGYYVQQTKDGRYIITGQTYGFDFNVYLIKTDSSGNILWTKTYGGGVDDQGFAVKETKNGGYIIAGFSNSFVFAAEPDIYLIKTDSEGNYLWSKTYGGADNDYGYFVQETLDNGFVICGNTYSNTTYEEYIDVIKTDSLGNSGCREDNPNTVVTIPSFIATNVSSKTSGGCIITNPITQTGSGGTTTTLCYTGINDLQNEKFKINISPNPFITSTTIEVQSSKNEVKSFVLYDVFGSVVRTLNFEHASQNFKLERGNFSSGIYFYKITSDNNMISTGKLIIE